MDGWMDGRPSLSFSSCLVFGGLVYGDGATPIEKRLPQFFGASHVRVLKSGMEGKCVVERTLGPAVRAPSPILLGTLTSIASHRKRNENQEMALLAGGVSAASIHDNVDNGAPPHMNGGGANGEANGAATAEGGGDGGGAAAGEDATGGGGGGGAAAAAIAAASASRAEVAGEARSAADGGGEIWVEPPVVVKKYNKVRRDSCFVGGGGE